MTLGHVHLFAVFLPVIFVSVIICIFAPGRACACCMFTNIINIALYHLHDSIIVNMQLRMYVAYNTSYVSLVAVKVKLG